MSGQLFAELARQIGHLPKIALLTLVNPALQLPRSKRLATPLGDQFNKLLRAQAQKIGRFER